MRARLLLLFCAGALSVGAASGARGGYSGGGGMGFRGSAAGLRGGMGFRGAYLGYRPYSYGYGSLRRPGHGSYGADGRRWYGGYGSYGRRWYRGRRSWYGGGWYGDGYYYSPYYWYGGPYYPWIYWGSSYYWPYTYNIYSYRDSPYSYYEPSAPAPDYGPPDEGSVQGNVRVNVQPANATVIVDGKAIEKAGRAIMSVSDGPHHFEITAPGYQTWVLDLDVKAGIRYYLEPRLQPKPEQEGE